MLQTLFKIPHALAGIPVLGWGWLLWAWLLVAAILLIRRFVKHGGDSETWGQVVWFGVIAGVIAWLLPHLEERASDGEPLGLAIRGYGVMLLLAVVSGVALSAYRGWRQGVHPEAILSLAFAMFVLGILGARAFFVVEYWRDFRRDTWLATLIEIGRFTEGGLVVYGSLIGGLIAFAAYCRYQKLPTLAIADVIVPGMALGLAIGRIGCLLNGCCFGGACGTAWYGVHFPAGSPPYMRQLESGELLGFQLVPEGSQYRVSDVVSGGAAAKRGLRVGDLVARYEVISPIRLREVLAADSDATFAVIQRVEQTPLSWSVREAPVESLPTTPTQIFSAANALLLCLLLLAVYPYRPREGFVMALGLTLYAFTRSLLEQIRIDEPGQWGTQWTVSQWVSLAVLIAVALLWIFVFALSPRRQLPISTDPQ